METNPLNLSMDTSLKMIGWIAYHRNYKNTLNPYMYSNPELRDTWDEGYKAAKNGEPITKWLPEGNLGCK